MPELIRFPLNIATLRGMLDVLDGDKPSEWAVTPILESGCLLVLQGDGDGSVMVSVKGPDW